MVGPTGLDVGFFMEIVNENDLEDYRRGGEVMLSVKW